MPINHHLFKIIILLKTMNILIFQEKPLFFLKTLVIFDSFELQNLVVLVHNEEIVAAGGEADAVATLETVYFLVNFVIHWANLHDVGVSVLGEDVIDVAVMVHLDWKS
jgi:hypothetical protein